MARSGASEVLDKPAEVPANITGFSVRLAGTPADAAANAERLAGTPADAAANAERLAGVPENNSEESDLIVQLAKITPENPI